MTMQSLKTIKVGSAVVKIYPDNDSDHDCPITEAYGSKDKGEGLKSEGIIFATFEKRSTLSDCHEFSEPAEAVKFAKENGWEAFNLNKYEHSAVAYSISSGYPFNDRWDAGQVGYVLIKKSAYRGSRRRAEIAESCDAGGLGRRNRQNSEGGEVMKRMVDAKGTEVMGGYEYKRIALDSVANYTLAEKLVEQGWKVVSSSLFAVLLEKRKAVK